MLSPKQSQFKKGLRAQRTRKKISGSEHIRLSVFRSNRFIYAQLINNRNNQTIAAVSDKELFKTIPRQQKLTKIEKARMVGRLIAQKAKQAKIEAIVFDRGPYRYHGRVKALAEGARQGGLKF